MKKKKWIPIAAAIVLLAVLFVPIPRGAHEDGGTREYVALTYKIVDWSKRYDDGTYEKTCFYFGSDRNKSVDELWQLEYEHAERKFVADVLEMNGDSVLVQPVPGEDERNSSDKISFSIRGFENIGAKVGSIVEITYTGNILESYPAQIQATGWKISKNLRHMEYTEQWLDQTTAEKFENGKFDRIQITKIYSNCFFAERFSRGEIIKLNGTLSKDWCVGDQIDCTYENAYYDKKRSRIEADLLTVEANNWTPDPNTVYDKPVIYLYPEEKIEVSVSLTFAGKLTCTYPAYHNGWAVTASPDGTLTDANGRTYNYLYWEGEADTQYDLSRGFCVKGEDTAAFLETALDQLGLTHREANEFIVYWLPLMEQNPYNIISFQTDRYTDAAQLEVKPAPDTLIRVFMTWQKSDSFVKLPEQELTAPERKGFTVVEWGGTEIK